MVTKICSKCLRGLGLGQFYKNRTTEDGLRSTCKDCDNTQKVKYRAENAEKISASSAKYYVENIEKRRAQSAAWHARNRERASAGMALWRSKNVDHVRANTARYNAENQEKIRVDGARWRAENPEKCTATSRMKRARKAGAVIGSIPEDIMAQLVELYGPTCMKPGCESTKLELDHIVPLSKGGAHAVENFQLLCKSCNASKGNWHSTDHRTDGQRVYDVDVVA